MNTGIKVLLIFIIVVAVAAIAAIATYFAVDASRVECDQQCAICNGSRGSFKGVKQPRIRRALNNRSVLFRHAPGPCTTLLYKDGSEDLEILFNGLAIISSGVLSYMEGKVLAFNMSEIPYRITEMSIVGDFNSTDYHPHGLATWLERSTGRPLLYILNHPPSGDRIDMFEVNSNQRRLTFIQSFSDSLFGSMNSLVIVDKDKFYITQTSSSQDATVWDREGESETGTGLLMFFDGQKAHIIESGFNMANGINGSPNRRYIYMAEYARGLVHVYKRDPRNNVKLEKIQTVDVGTGVDNIRVDSAGDMWIGCHPSHRKFFDYIFAKGQTDSPSQVLRLKMNPSGSRIVDVIEVYLDKGSEMSGSTVAAVRGNKLLIGSVASQFVMCNLTCSQD